jgi:hypothetical protein
MQRLRVLFCQPSNDFMKRAGLLLFICVLYFSCQKDNGKSFQNFAVITGINPCEYACILECPCSCGNLLFHFTDTVYTANIPVDNPSIFKLPSNIQYPVYVEVDWQNTSRCGVTAIKITNYRIL